MQAMSRTVHSTSLGTWNLSGTEKTGKLEIKYHIQPFFYPKPCVQPRENAERSLWLSHCHVERVRFGFLILSGVYPHSRFLQSVQILIMVSNISKNFEVMGINL